MAFDVLIRVMQKEVPSRKPVGYGEEGEGFVRIAMVENEQRIRQAARNVRRFLAEHTPAAEPVALVRRAQG